MNEMRTFFEDNGYYLAKGVFSPGEVGRLEDEFDRIVGSSARTPRAPRTITASSERATCSSIRACGWRLCFTSGFLTLSNSSSVPTSSSTTPRCSKSG